MKYNRLGQSDLKVSEICLGTMTWGAQNTKEDAFEQMDYSLGEGVNFFDTAELYAIPRARETQGKTEEIIGDWFEAHGKRDHVILATKVAGEGAAWIRDSGPISRKSIKSAIETSLKRLKTDYIDLYQLHWPNRGSYHFGQMFGYDASHQNTAECEDNFLEVLSALHDLRQTGVIREVGLSNETAWGIMRYMQVAKENGFPAMVSMQNEYSLLYRLFDTHMAEVSHHENVGLLAYSPLCRGLLSGKYNSGDIPQGSRAEIIKNLNGRLNEKSIKASIAYTSCAEKYDLDPSQMALAFVLSRPFTSSVIVGATKMEQLKTNILAKEISLTEDMIKDLEEIYHQYPICF